MKVFNTVIGVSALLALAACDSKTENAQEPAAESSAMTEAPAQEAQAVEEPGDTVLEILTSPHRSDANRARDQYRNPEETLFFFGLERDDTVIEVNPGGGWYMEIIAPFVKDEGQYIAAQPNPELADMPAYIVRQAEQIQTRFEEQEAVYGDAELMFYNPADPSLGEPESADMVLTFRNTHNWINAGQAPAMFAAFAEVLKPGGVLGVVQHRAEDGASAEETASSGYVSEQEVIDLAEAAGLELEDRSNINANPRDTHDHPEGVWTLPPTLRLGDENRDVYMEIGESDRMTLRFVKPDPQ
ncbi:class I SAM-dependent methyltransferase [Marinimicrobium agarilyticum]|uniref:class I SAM-dependent methyltransferase n=1 Tax=Marinimicrobium agarilyticum TaxID=306546 RepID=UPI0004242AAA|nr:methyltransferase domain-containing protein [Marinimicrobium agarilyticum]